MTIDPVNQQDRKLLRQDMLARRDQLTVEMRAEKGRALACRLEDFDCFNKARAILFFVSFRSEVDTFVLMDHALARGVQVTVPLTITATKELNVFAVTDLQKDLVPGYQGILEPDPDRCPPVDPAVLDLVVVPGSVFDRHGGRMGYGGGYYDRFLANRAPQATRLGLCFDLQVVNKVPMAAHDQYLDYLVTESDIVKTGQRRSFSGSDASSPNLYGKMNKRG